jgi:murein DD-endopeptidase MepM/ murein hydrolase activator NlpD
VPRGRWRLATDVPGFFRAADDVLSVGTRSVQADVRLQRGGVVSGVVVDASGAPVKNATLVLRDQSAGQRTRPVASPTVRLRWVHPLAGPRQMPRFPMSHFGAARAGPRPAECGRGHCGVDLGGKKGTPVHAAADGEVTQVVREIRKESGRFVVIEHAGGIRTHYLHLEEIRDDLEVGMKVRAGDPIATVGRTGVIKSGPHLHFAMSQERGGRTYYVDAEPMLRHAVVLASPRGLDWIGPELGAPTPVAAAGTVDPGPRFTTDARGEFRLEGISPGEYVVAAFQASFAPGVSDPLEVRSGEVTAGVTIRLSPGVVLHGRVLARGIPVAGARVVAEEGLGESSHRVATTYTDARGEYELRSVAGKVVLAASATGFGAAERAIDLGPGGASREKRREDFDLVIEDGKLFGEVRDADGHGLAGVTVRIVEGPTARRRTTTDARGAFLLPRVAPGDYVLELSSADFPATRVELTSDRSRLLTLEAGGSVRVDLRDAHTGDGLPQIQLDVTGPGDRALHPRTDAAGIALVRGLTPGRWTFRARAAGYAGAERTVDVEAGRTPQPLRLDLARGAIVAGIVRDHYGRRVSGARVWINDAETHTDNDGNFRITDAPTGAIDLQATLGTATGTLPLDLRPGDELVTLTLDLSE